MTRTRDQLVREYLAGIGRKGGQARAAKYGKATLRKWAKLGGRPRKPWSQLSDAGKYARKHRASPALREAKGGECNALPKRQA